MLLLILQRITHLIIITHQHNHTHTHSPIQNQTPHHSSFISLRAINKLRYNEFASLLCGYENLIDDDLQLNADGTQSNRNSTYMSRELHRPLLSMPPIVLMGAPCAVSPSPIVEMPPSPAPNQVLIVEFPCDNMEGVLNIEDLMDDDRAIIDGDEDTDVGEDLEDDDADCYFAEGAIEVSCG